MQVVFVIFIAIIVIQLCYYLILFSQFSFTKSHKNKQSDFPVSVLICARNESKNLRKYLPLILQQNYPNFELVLINDGSNDDTLEVFKFFKEKHLHSHQIKIVDVLQNESLEGNKKHAVSLGINAATYEHLLFTDADCWPASENWISEMTSQFYSEKKIVLGYGSYKKSENSFLNKLIRFETVFTALQYFSYAKLGVAYMGVGRNLGYKKTLFEKNNGFDKHLHIKSGDDDLFINQVATKNNVAIVFTADSFTISEPKTTFKSWIQQKRRHISTAHSYKPMHQLLLGLSYASQLLFWVFTLLIIFLNQQLELALFFIGIRIAIQYLIIGVAAKKLKENDLIIWVPFLELFLIFIHLFIFIKNKRSKPTHW
ncbi:MAG: glycosyltransferase [Flavobacteriaceae bacterium]|nr:glycosyltransferase [Flavobacteriaceae bacterium]